jgi:hypothetical protein
MTRTLVSPSLPLVWASEHPGATLLQALGAKFIAPCSFALVAFGSLTSSSTEGRANPDRTWTECFAQLVGTVLSLWDAAELDAAGEDGEVLPKFINLTDASIKMVGFNLELLLL